jgi:hypothetical protein
MQTLEDKLLAAQQEHANSMEQVSKWGARAQRAAGAIEVLEKLISEKSADAFTVEPMDVDPM